MRICVTGASGFIGQTLIEILEPKRHQCVSVKRRLLYGPADELRNLLTGCDAVINLAGAPIMQRWTTKNKQTIYSSRIETTLNLATALHCIPEKTRPKTFISASAVGIYKSGETHDEYSQLFDSGFTGTIVRDWEKAIESVPKSIRRVIFRTGVVLGKKSQTMKKLVPLFRLGLGGKVGSGKQPFPFIHVNDLSTAFEDALNDTRYNGIYNLVAPDRINNAEFARCLSQKLDRPAFLPVPPFVIRVLYGNASALLLEGANVLPRRLLEAGFDFQYPTIAKSLDQILSS